MMKEVIVFNELFEADADKDFPSIDGFWVEAESLLSVNRVSHFHTHKCDCFSISLLYHGSVDLILKGNTAVIHAPVVLLLEKGEVPAYTFSSDCLLVSLCFSAEFLEKHNMPWNSYLNKIFIQNVIPLAGAKIEDYHKCFSLIIQENLRNGAMGHALIANLLMMIFKMIANMELDTDQLEKVPASRLTYFRFKTLIDQCFKKQHHVQPYADQLCMTAEMLGKIVKDIVNKTPKQLIDERLITEAKRMLVYTRTSNKEIAYDLGFESDSYFNRYFKRHCHQTPLSFRLHARVPQR